jgi:hypothetical protein
LESACLTPPPSTPLRVCKRRAKKAENDLGRPVIQRQQITGEVRYDTRGIRLPSPALLDEAIELLVQNGEDARVVAGGHSLVPMMKLRLAKPEHLIDLQELPHPERAWCPDYRADDRAA